jgi:F420-dependent oxidoreductase-like protein
MKLRIFTEPQQGASYDTLLRIAQATETGGFDAFFRSDHYLKMGSSTGLPGPSDAWITLAGIARETKRIKLGTLMTAATFRLPGPLAIEVANVDDMSSGRIELGLGAGWYGAEHAAYGISFPSVKDRFDRFEEQLAIITGIWDTPTGERFNFAGKHYQLTDNPGLPKPHRRPPIIVGGGGARRTPTLAARYAEEFNLGFTSVANTEPAFDRVREICAREGRTKPIGLSTAQVVCCGRDDTEVKRRAETLGRDPAEMRENGMAGTPSELVEKMGRFAEIGCDTIYLQLLDLSDLDHLELLASDVLPHA